MLFKIFYILKIIISSLGLFCLTIQITFLIEAGLTEFFKQKTEHVCKYFLIDTNGNVSCKKKRIQIEKDTVFPCRGDFFEENHFWLEASYNKNSSILIDELKVKKEFLETCFEK